MTLGKSQKILDIIKHRVYNKTVKYDFQEPYLRTVFGFVGITGIVFINGQPMDALGVEVANEKVRESQALARKAAEGIF